MYSLGYKSERIGWVMHCCLFKDIHFAWLEALGILANNPIN